MSKSKSQKKYDEKNKDKRPIKLKKTLKLISFILSKKHKLKKQIFFVNTSLIPFCIRLLLFAPLYFIFYFFFIYYLKST